MKTERIVISGRLKYEYTGRCQRAAGTGTSLWAGGQEWWQLSMGRAGPGCPQPDSMVGQGAARSSPSPQYQAPQWGQAKAGGQDQA